MTETVLHDKGTGYVTSLEVLFRQTLELNNCRMSLYVKQKQKKIGAKVLGWLEVPSASKRFSLSPLTSASVQFSLTSAHCPAFTTLKFSRFSFPPMKTRRQFPTGSGKYFHRRNRGTSPWARANKKNEAFFFRGNRLQGKIIQAQAGLMLEECLKRSILKLMPWRRKNAFFLQMNATASAVAVHK